MKQPIWLMLGLTVMGFGQLTWMQSAMAQDSGNPPNRSDTTGIIIDGSNSGNNTGLSGDLRGNVDPNSEVVTIGALGRGFGISPEVINLIPTFGGPVRQNTDPNAPGSSSLGDTGDSSEITDDIAKTGDSSEITDDIAKIDDSSEITICSSDPCVPDDGIGKAITLNDLAKLIEDDLNKSFDDLVAAEKLEQELIERPRRIIKRSCSDSCDSDTACTSPALEARREFEKKLQNSQEFIEAVIILKHEYRDW